MSTSPMLQPPPMISLPEGYSVDNRAAAVANLLITLAKTGWTVVGMPNVRAEPCVPLDTRKGRIEKQTLIFFKQRLPESEGQWLKVNKLFIHLGRGSEEEEEKEVTTKKRKKKKKNAIATALRQSVVEEAAPRQSVTDDDDDDQDGTPTVTFLDPCCFYNRDKREHGGGQSELAREDVQTLTWDNSVNDEVESGEKPKKETAVDVEATTATIPPPTDESRQSVTDDDLDGTPSLSDNSDNDEVVSGEKAKKETTDDVEATAAVTPPPTDASTERRKKKRKSENDYEARQSVDEDGHKVNEDGEPKLRCELCIWHQKGPITVTTLKEHYSVTHFFEELFGKFVASNEFHTCCR